MFEAGQKIGSYTLVKRLGKGGFGEVWLADWETKFATTKVAVKLPLDEQVDHALIEQEAQLWAKASGHTNVLPIIEANEYDGQIVIVSEYAPDGSLEQLLKNNGGKLPVKQAIEMTIGILNGLEFLHSRNIIHRDLKPANVLLQGETPRLADFGISRAMRTTMASRSQHISGTFAYMSPEALDGKRTVQTDIWSVGVNLYQLLTGKLPFPQKEFTHLLTSIATKTPEPLSNDIPSELKEIIAKALEKNPENRYQNSVEMREDLKKFLHPDFSTTPITSVPKTFESEVLTEVITNVIQKTKTHPTEFKPIEISPKSVVTNIKLSPVIKENELSQQSQPNEKHRILLKSSDLFLFPYRKGDKFGFCDRDKHLYIPPIYISVSPFREGLSQVWKLWGNGKYGEYLGEIFGRTEFIDKTGKTIFGYNHFFYGYHFDEFNEGIIKCSDSSSIGRYCYFNAVGEKLTRFKYDHAELFNEGLACVGIKKGYIRTYWKYGFIDEKGNESIPLKFDEAKPFNEGVALTKINQKYGFIDKAGREIIPYYYDKAKSFSEDLACVTINRKSGYIDKSGNYAIPLQYGFAESFSEGLARVGDGFIDKQGKLVISSKEFDFCENSFSEGLVVVKKNDKEGFINKIGSLVIPYKYDRGYSKSFIEGLALVRLDEKYGFIDKTGKEVIKPKYEYATSFYNGTAEVELNGRRFYIDKNGTEYYEP